MKLPYPVAAMPLPLHAPMHFGAEDGDDTTTDVDDDTEEGDEGAATLTAEELADQRALERQARAQGWRPEAEFKGEKGQWVDASTFLERGANFKKSLQREIDALKAKVAKSEETNRAFAAFHKEAMARKERELDEAIRQTKRDHREAVRNGEDEQADLLDSRLETLQDEKSKLKNKPDPTPEEIEAENRRKAKAVSEGKEPLPPAMQDWLDDGNTWFRDNARMRNYALAIGDELRAAGDTSMDREFLDKVTAQMHEDFPAFFKKEPEKKPGNPLRDRPGSTEGGQQRGTPQTPGRTAKDLPAEDRALMKKFVADKLLTEEQFLKDYNW